MNPPDTKHIWLELLKNIFKDSQVDEIFVTGSKKIAVKRHHQYTFQTSLFTNHQEATREIQTFAFQQGERLDPGRPSAGGVLDDHQYRWHGVIPPLSPRHPLFCLRKHRFTGLSMNDFQASKNMQKKLAFLMQNQQHLLICGPTGSGKSSLLHALLKENALTERIAILENHLELPHTGALWFSLTTFSRLETSEEKSLVNISTLLQDSLRLNPDRIVIGELHGHDLLGYLEAAVSGHKSTISTIHSHNSNALLSRIKITLSKTSNYTIDPSILNSLWAIVLERNPRPRVKEIICLTEL